MGVNPINTNLNDRTLLYDKLDKIAVIGKLRKLLEPDGSYKLRIEDGKFVPRGTAMAWNHPWVYVQSLDGARCDIYHSVFFELLDHIHSYCLDCWKVVVRPRTVVELFDLYELQKQMDVPCKCGTEPRDTVNGLYGGYFYCRGKQAGLERYNEVRQLLPPEIDVILKRACTEFELVKGDSDQWPELIPEEEAMETIIENMFPRMGFGGRHPRHIDAWVMLRWIKWAYEHGDQTYKELTTKPLLEPLTTYHQGGE